MPNLKKIETEAKGVAASHVIFFLVVALIVGFALDRIIH